jgi:hypothetical protein
MQNLNFTSTPVPVAELPILQALVLADEASQKHEAEAQAEVRMQLLRSFDADSDCV